MTTVDLQRVKMLQVPQRDIEEILSAVGEPVTIRFRNADVPEDFEIVSTHFEPLTRSFQFVIYHPQFPIVSDDAELQIIPGRIKVAR